MGRPSFRTSELLERVADEEVNITRKEYFPQLSLEAKQLYIGQNIDQTDSIFQQGTDEYENTRMKAEINQPLLDLTLKHKLNAADASKRVVVDTGRVKREAEVEFFITNMLSAARYANLELSLERVMARLEDELIKVNENFDAKLATLEDLETVRAAAAAMRQEKRSFGQQVKVRFFELGIDPLSPNDLLLSDGLDLPLDDFAGTDTNVHIDALEAEVDYFESQIKAAKYKDAPSLGLYGLYIYDNAVGSLFGGERSLQVYEVGVSLRWNFFDRGINRAEIRRLTYLKQAKEQEIQALPDLREREINFAAQRVEVAQETMGTYASQVGYQRNIMEASEQSYEEGGHDSYINMINAYLIYEALLWQEIHGKFDYIEAQLELAAAKHGWIPELLGSLDDLFVKSE